MLEPARTSLKARRTEDKQGSGKSDQYVPPSPRENRILLGGIGYPPVSLKKRLRRKRLSSSRLFRVLISFYEIYVKNRKHGFAEMLTISYILEGFLNMLKSRLQKKEGLKKFKRLSKQKKRVVLLQFVSNRYYKVVEKPCGLSAAAELQNS